MKVGSKFFGLKNKGKKRSATIEAPNTDAFSEQELTAMLDELNAPVVEETVIDKPIPPVLEKQEVVHVAKHNEENFIAYGICYNEEKKKYMLFSIDYNPKTGYSEVIGTEEYADSAPTALNKLNRIMSLKLLKKEERY